MVSLNIPCQFKFFKGCLPQILTGPFLNILSHLLGNKNVLDSHGYHLKEKTIKPLLFVKDELFRVSGLVKFNVTQDLISKVKGALAKYIADFEEEKSYCEAQNYEQLKVVKEWCQQSARNKDL